MHTNKLFKIRFGYARGEQPLPGMDAICYRGSMNPSVKSQANLFIAPKSGNKEVKFQYYHYLLSNKNAFYQY